MTGLYRWLLHAYPADYRRERGLEIVHTFLDAGRPRPSGREAINLVRHGMRARLGRPASRTVVLWAALFSLVCGLFVAAAATRLAWATARPLPDRAEATPIFETVLPGQDWAEEFERSPATFVIGHGEPLSLANAGQLLDGYGGGYTSGETTSDLMGATLPEAGQILPEARERLRANGWTVGETIVRDVYICSDPPCDPAALPKNYRVIAHKGDTVLEMLLDERSLAGETRVAVRLQRATPWAAHPAGALGGLLGALGGWLLFGWVSRRTDAAFRTAVNTLFGITLFLWGAPILPSAMVWGIKHNILQPRPRWHPLWDWLGQPSFSLAFVIGGGFGLVALGLAAFARRRRVLTEVSSA